MLKLKRIRFKNILSFGDMWTDIEFKGKKNILVIGQNGVGKSASILDTICFGLFGKPFRKISKPRLINHKNRRGLLVEVFFSTDKGKEYRVLRGMNPQVFEIYEDEKLVPVPASIKDYQNTLEKQILKIDFQAFTQIVILGKATYVAFLRLNALERRTFLEQVLDLGIFSRMNEINKARFTESKRQMSEVTTEIRTLRDKIKLTQRHISQMEEEAKKVIEDQLAQLETELEELNAEIDKQEWRRSMLLDSLDETVEGRLEKASASMDRCNEFAAKFRASLSTIQRKLKFFEENDVCPTCESELTFKTKNSKRSELQAKERELAAGQEQLAKKQQEIATELEAARAGLDENHKVGADLRVVDSIVNTSHERINNINARKIELLTPQADKLEDQRAGLIRMQGEEKDQLDARYELTQASDCYEFINSMLKDTGIKATIIKSRIPAIQEIMNRYLKLLGMFVKFELDENFEETLYARGIEPQTYQGFSEGEKLRIDLAMLMTWREVCRLQSSMAFNVLIFDEILDASLDESGAESLVHLFRQLGYEGTTVIVISHSAARWEDKFSECWEVRKDNGFSKIVVDVNKS